jgi:hypothetical protein
LNGDKSHYLDFSFLQTSSTSTSDNISSPNYIPSPVPFHLSNESEERNNISLCSPLSPNFSIINNNYDDFLLNSIDSNNSSFIHTSVIEDNNSNINSLPPEFPDSVSSPYYSPYSPLNINNNNGISIKRKRQIIKDDGTIEYLNQKDIKKKGRKSRKKGDNGEEVDEGLITNIENTMLKRNNGNIRFQQLRRNSQSIFSPTLPHKKITDFFISLKLAKKIVERGVENENEKKIIEENDDEFSKFKNSFFKFGRVPYIEDSTLESAYKNKTLFPNFAFSDTAITPFHSSPPTLVKKFHPLQYSKSSFDPISSSPNSPSVSSSSILGIPFFKRKAEDSKRIKKMLKLQKKKKENEKENSSNGKKDLEDKILAEKEGSFDNIDSFSRDPTSLTSDVNIKEGEGIKNDEIIDVNKSQLIKKNENYIQIQNSVESQTSRSNSVQQPSSSLSQFISLVNYNVNNNSDSSNITELSPTISPVSPSFITQISRPSNFNKDSEIIPSSGIFHGSLKGESENPEFDEESNSDFSFDDVFENDTQIVDETKLLDIDLDENSNNKINEENIQIDNYNNSCEKEENISDPLIMYNLQFSPPPLITLDMPEVQLNDGNPYCIIAALPSLSEFVSFCPFFFFE